MIRITYTADGRTDVRCLVFVGAGRRTEALSGVLAIRAEDWDAFRRQLEACSPPVAFLPEDKLSIAAPGSQSGGCE